MQIGICANMLASMKDGTGAEWLPQIKAAGFDYVELPMVQLSALPIPEYSAIVCRLEQLALPCWACNNLVPAAHKIVGVHVDTPAVQQYIKRAVSIMRDLGVKRVVVGSAGARNAPDGFSKERAVAQFSTFLSQLGDVLPAGVIAVVEPLNKLESNIIHTIPEGIAAARAANRQNIKTLADLYHMKKENEPLDDILAASSDIAHTHIASGENRSVPLGYDPDIAAFLFALEQSGYDQMVSVEGYVSSPSEDIAKSLMAMRDMRHHQK